MSDLVIADPIINGPFDEPARHFRFDATGITDEVVEGRRPSSYFVPVPRPRKGNVQLEIPELTADQIEVNQQVNSIRARVGIWRSRQYDGATPTTRRLLEYWADQNRDNRVLFAQREAAETAIYLAEAAQRHGDVWIGNDLDKVNAEHNDGLPRAAMKMATGTGKTVVMAMLIAWQTLNKIASPHDKRYGKRFLVVTPGITIRDRLRVLRPEDAENYYRLRDLVPADMWPGLGQARIAITNFHAFLPRERGMGKGVSSLTKDVLSLGGRSPFLETPDQIASRVLADLGGGTSEVVVFNDEAHHCYRGRTAAEEGADTERTLTGQDRREAKDRNAEARVWFTGLMAVKRKAGVKVAYDLSATPFFLSGSGYREGTLFPWVVSDFSLIDAIESGLVKIPRVPVDDDRVASRVTYLNLWHEVRDQLPRKSRREVDPHGPPHLPAALEGALQSLYGSYVKAFKAWQESDAAAYGQTPPVFIVVCNNTTVSKIVFDWIAGWRNAADDQESTLVPGRLDLFSNVVDGELTARPRSILIDSAQLESGEGMSTEFKRMAATEIDEFKEDFRRRFPGRSADDITDEDLLREVLNTVGKPGRLGEHIRCVVSVSMLTEGWDANTVTHILGVRAFGTQLLCEQVVGRGLRRRSYAVDETGRFTPEYADVYGVPFQFIPTVAPTKDVTIKPTRRVHAEPQRTAAEITFPRLVGYRVELPDTLPFDDVDNAEPFVVSKDSLPTYTLVSGVVGDQDLHSLEELRPIREQTVAYEIAHVLLDRYFRTTAEDPRPWYFPQTVDIVKRWMRACVTYYDDTFPGLLLLTENLHHAAEQVWNSVIRQEGNRHARMLPMLRAYDTVGSTAEVDFFTTREVYPTSESRCHVTYVVLDGGNGNAWERTVAQALETMPGVAAYVKNDHLGFTVPYTHKGRTHNFVPDFLVRLGDAGDALVRTLVVEVSGGRKDQAMRAAKSDAVRNLWLPAVNNDGRWGRWGYCEIMDPARAKLDIGQATEALRGTLEGRGSLHGAQEPEHRTQTGRSGNPR